MKYLVEIHYNQVTLNRLKVEVSTDIYDERDVM